MTEAAQLHVMSIEQSWRDGLKAIDEQYTEAGQSRQRWIRIGRGLLAGRQKCPPNRSFNEWLDHTGYVGVTRDERPDAMWMAVNAETVLRALSETRIVSPTRARRHLRENIAALYKQCNGVPSVTKDSATGDEVHQIAESSETTMPEVALDTSPAQESVVEQRTELPSLKRGWLHGLDRADEVMAVFQHAKTRSTVGRIAQTGGGKQIWCLLLQAIDGGLTYPNTVMITRLTARLLFPYGGARAARFCHSFDLTKAAVRDRLRAELLPSMVANRDALIANPDDIEELLEKAHQRAAMAQRATLVEERAVKAIAALPAGECEVIMFGKRMWPIVEGETIGTYDFETLQVAIWKFTDLNRWLHRDNVGTRAINIRNSTKWDQNFITKLMSGESHVRVRRMYSLVHHLTLLMEKNPDGECKEPLTPLVLG
jgi:hypothetical protein